MVKILLDQNTFDKHNGKYLDTTNVLHFLKLHKNKTYLIKNDDEELKDNVEEYIKGVISYSKNNLRRNPSKVFQDILETTNIKSLSELLVITSDQELIYLFENIPVKTCLIYKNQYDCMEVNPTYEFHKLDEVKKLILK